MLCVNNTSRGDIACKTQFAIVLNSLRPIHLINYLTYFPKLSLSSPNDSNKMNLYHS